MKKVTVIIEEDDESVPTTIFRFPTVENFANLFLTSELYREDIFKTDKDIKTFKLEFDLKPDDKGYVYSVEVTKETIHVLRSSTLGDLI